MTTLAHDNTDSNHKVHTSRSNVQTAMDTKLASNVQRMEDRNSEDVVSVVRHQMGVMSTGHLKASWSGCRWYPAFLHSTIVLP